MSRRGGLLAADQVRIFLTLVPYLIERGEVTVAEAAAEFDVTPVQLRKIVRRLPLVGLPGEDDYFQMPHEMFDIDWDLLDSHDVIALRQGVALERAPRLTAREAAALLAGLRFAQAIPAVASSELLASLVAKLARGASRTPVDLIVATTPVDEVRALMSRALRAQLAVAFTYHPPDAAPTTRTVDPLHILVTEAQWYLQGWCHLRRAMRTFHLDRVSDAVVTDIPVTHVDSASADEHADEGEHLAVVRYPAGLEALLGDYLRHADITVDGDVATAEIRLADATGLRRLVARLGGRVEIVAPAAARTLAAEWARAALDLYETG